MAINLANLITGGIGESVAKIAGAFKEDPTKKAEFQAAVDANSAEFQLTSLKLEKQIEIEINEQANAIALAQIALNTQDAKGSLFQSSWRPLVGYICASGLGYQILLRPLINFAAQLFSSKAVAEQLDMGTLLSLLIPMLGLGAYRTVEKLQGKQ
jgi:hypothetical protein